MAVKPTYTTREKLNILQWIKNEGISLRGASRKPKMPHYNTLYKWQNEGVGERNDYPANKQSVVLVIPDMHAPFVHPDALDFLKAVKARFLPSKFVCLGDEVDFHAFSRYPKDPDGLTPGQELSCAREALIPFYLEFPEMLVCISNHT